MDEKQLNQWTDAVYSDIRSKNKKSNKKSNLVDQYGKKYNSRTTSHKKHKSKMSKGEEAIYAKLKKEKIKFETQKTFKGLKDKGSLRFDFFLTDLNICIEFDGKQHSEPVKFFGGEKGLKKRQKRDAIKNKYCWKNGIVLLRITEISAIEKLEIDRIQKTAA